MVKVVSKVKSLLFEVRCLTQYNFTVAERIKDFQIRSSDNSFGTEQEMEEGKNPESGSNIQ